MPNRIFRKVAIILASILLSSNSTPAAIAEDVVKVGKSGSSYVSRDIAWDPQLLHYASEKMVEQKAVVEEFLSTVSKGANSLTITRDEDLLLDGVSLASYPFFDRYNHKLRVQGFGDFGSNVSDEKWAPVLSDRGLELLSSLPVGKCRLSWSLFNVDTWFSPDCSVSVASPETYLRSSLIIFLDNSPVQGTDGYFFELSSLEMIASQHLPYEIRDGRLFSDGLDDVYRDSGLALSADFERGGWDITIDPNDKWVFTFTPKATSAKEIAASGRVITSAGQTWITFTP